MGKSLLNMSAELYYISTSRYNDTKTPVQYFQPLSFLLWVYDCLHKNYHTDSLKESW